MRLTYRQCASCDTTAALPDGQRWCGFCERGYRRALRHAVDAVKALEYDGTYCKVVHSCEALIAIDALGLGNRPTEAGDSGGLPASAVDDEQNRR